MGNIEHNIIFWTELLGTFVFGLTDAFRAIWYELDLLGVTVLSTAVCVGGGMTRDVLLDMTPPLRSGVRPTCWSQHWRGSVYSFSCRELHPHGD
ncbi:trimeric intracellular cation channel family protein [Candidatus Latescibacterota bacterium]